MLNLERYETSKPFIYPCFVPFCNRDRLLLESDVVVLKTDKTLPPVTLRIIADFGRNGLASACLTYDILEQWGVTAKEVYENSLQLTDRFLVEPLDHIIMEFDNGYRPCDKAADIFVVTNSHRYYGAGTILSKEVRNRCFDLLQTDRILVCPSSVHEVIVLSEDSVRSPDEVSEVIRSINEAHVSKDEWLDDKVWAFSKEGI